MANKIMIGILVLLIVLLGGTGYYSYTLSEKIDYLSAQLTTFEDQQQARINAVSNALAILRSETMTSINALESRTGEMSDEIDALKGEIGKTEGQVASLENEIHRALSQIGKLDDRIAELSDSIVDAGEMYEKVQPATVRISNGQGTVGSGYILGSDGYVVTAYHVVENLSQIYVMLSDGTVTKATYTGGCKFSDISVLKLDNVPSISPPPLVNSSHVRIGDPVIAVGSPLGIRDTLTAGVISQTNQYAEIQYNTSNRWIANLLQFDTAVNPGNSGCPLANSDGDIVGIVIAKISPTEGYGINYAVSSNKVRRVATALIEQGYFEYPWIGVGISDLTPQIIQERGLETANGVLVTWVFSGGPADSAGIMFDDIIVSIDGTEVSDSADLTSYLGEFTAPGDISEIELIRGNARLSINIEIGKREE